MTAIFPGTGRKTRATSIISGIAIHGRCKICGCIGEREWEGVGVGIRGREGNEGRKEETSNM